MPALLDVNVLIALLDAAHLHHRRAMAWLHDHIDQGWASCPITQNGCVRIMSQSGYPNRRPVADIARRLHAATDTPMHTFWADNLSLLDSTHIDCQQLLLPRQITDAYLLALAAKYGGAFVTFDRAIALPAVPQASAENLIVL